MTWRAAAALSLVLLGASRADAQFPVMTNYPSAALREGRQGTTYFTVDIDETGRPANCVITKSSGSQDLDEATCREITQKARFRPTIENGKPIRRTLSSKIVWVIPD